MGSLNTILLEALQGRLEKFSICVLLVEMLVSLTLSEIQPNDYSTRTFQTRESSTIS